MEYLLFVLVFMLFIAVVIIEKESIQRYNKLCKRLKKLCKKIDSLALCTVYLIEESGIDEKLQKGESIGRKK